MATSISCLARTAAANVSNPLPGTGQGPRGGDIVHLALHWHARGVRPEVDPETGDKKSIYVITADGRLAQLWDTDMWNLDFPADHF